MKTASSRKRTYLHKILYCLMSQWKLHNSFVQLPKKYANYFDNPHHVDMYVNIKICVNVKRCWLLLLQHVYPKGTSLRIDVNSTSILQRYIEDQISMNFHVISTYFFDVISPIEKSTSFPRSFLDVISLVENSALLSRTFYGVILLVKKPTLFPRAFFDVISMVEKLTLFPRTFFDVISMVKISMLFLLTLF